MNKKILSFISAVLALSMLAACGGGNAGSGAPSGSGSGSAPTGAVKDELIVAITADPRSFDPFGSNDSTSSTYKDQMFDTLFKQSEGNEVVPSLVDTYKYVDDTTLELTVKEGIKFHNGSDLTVGDVLYTIKRGIDSEYTTWIVENIDLENSKILEDGKTLQLKLKAPKGDQLAALCFLYIVDEETVSAEGYDPETNPVGTGAFAFAKQVKGDRVEYTANKEYWDGAPKYNKLTFRVITESASRTIEVESGGVDIIYNVQPSDIPLLEQNGDVVVHRSPNFSNQWIGFNYNRAPFTDVKVRQAINYALDKEAIVEAVWSGTGTVAKGPMPETVWGYTDDVPAYTYDPDKAKALLKEAGFEDGFKTTMTVSDNQVRMDTAEIVQNQLGQVGIEVEVIVLENATYLDKVVANDFDMFALGWTTNTGDADYALYETYHTGMPTWSNCTQFSNPEVDKLLEEGRTSIDPEVRKKAYAQVQKLLVEEAPQVFLWNGEEILAARSNVKGLVLAPSGRHNFASCYFE